MPAHRERPAAEVGPRRAVRAWYRRRNATPHSGKFARSKRGNVSPEAVYVNNLGGMEQEHVRGRIRCELRPADVRESPLRHRERLPPQPQHCSRRGDVRRLPGTVESYSAVSRISTAFQLNHPTGRSPARVVTDRKPLGLIMSGQRRMKAALPPAGRMPVESRGRSRSPNTDSGRMLC